MLSLNAYNSQNNNFLYFVAFDTFWKTKKNLKSINTVKGLRISSQSPPKGL